MFRHDAFLINGIDPSLTKLLLNFEDSNGSTTFTDSSPSAHPITIGADSPVITTTEKPFGSSSLSLNGSSYLQTDQSSDFNLTGKQVFTLEFFMFAPSLSTGQPVSMRNGGVYCPIEVRGDGTLLVGNDEINSWATTSYGSGVTLTLNAWNHVRIVGDGNTLKVYINGVNNNNNPISHPNWSSSNRKIYVGRGGDGFFTGNIKSVRLRYEVMNTGNFTPPNTLFTY